MFVEIIVGEQLERSVMTLNPIKLVVWDAPNMDMTLSEVLELDRAPLRAERPDMEKLLRWLREQTPATTKLVPIVYINVTLEPGEISRREGWVDYLLRIGWNVFARPKQLVETEAGPQIEGDIDDDMIMDIGEYASSGRLAEVVVGSHDARNFFSPLVALALEDGVGVTVLGFSERARAFMTKPYLDFVDLRNIPELFERPPAQSRPPGLTLRYLPEVGRLFPPDPQSWIRNRERATPAPEPAAVEPDAQAIPMPPVRDESNVVSVEPPVSEYVSFYDWADCFRESAKRYYSATWHSVTNHLDELGFEYRKIPDAVGLPDCWEISVASILLVSPTELAEQRQFGSVIARDLAVFRVYLEERALFL